MQRIVGFASVLVLLFAMSASAQDTQSKWKGAGHKGAVAAGGQEAVDAGMTLLKNGGNAADAAVATILALSVTDSTSFCFGGEVPIMVYDKKRDVIEVVCGLGTAPKLATREHFAQKGIPGSGVEPAAVPGAFGGCLTTLDRYGTKTFAEVAAPMLALLDHGKQPWHADLAKTIRRLIEAEKASPKDRSRGLRLVNDYFYRGPIAHELDEWSRNNGGLIRYTDLAVNTTRIEDPVSVDYHGYTVYKCGVWTQGPYLLQTLRLLEPFDFKSMGHNKPDMIHTSLEALKLALADRDVYYADPLFANIPLQELLSPKYAELRRPLIDPKQASLTQRPGDPLGGKALLEKPDLKTGPGGPAFDTTTCVVADSQGNVVAATPSGFSGVVAGKTGIKLGTRLQSFNIWADSPNCIEPGKRPRITLTPTLVMKDGKPVMAISVAGGDGQDQTTLQLLLKTIDFGLSPADAVSSPRYQTDHLLNSFRQKPPILGSLNFSQDIGAAAINDLKARGHKVTVKNSPLTNPVMLRIDLKTGLIQAAGDPKSRRHAAAY